MPSKPVDYRAQQKPANESPKQTPQKAPVPQRERTAPPAQRSSVEESRPKIDPAILRRSQGKRPDPPPDPPSVSAGPVDRVIELAFNPSREKIPEVTIIDRLQGRLLPQLTLIAQQWQYVLEVAYYRQDSSRYATSYKRPVPVSPSLIAEYMYSLAQWQKSIGGKNLERATDIALAETETRGEEDTSGGGGDTWKE